MKPGGYVVMMENGRGSNFEIFLPMIEEGGGKFIEWVPEVDVCGHSHGMYYVVSKW